jgi:hypothetical protein
MAIATRFRHHLVVERLVATGGTTPRGHANKALQDHHTTRGLIEELTGREETGPDLQGPVVANARIYLAIADDVREGDFVRNTSNEDRRYEVLFVADPGGRGRHQEADARRIQLEASE